MPFSAAGERGGERGWGRRETPLGAERAAAITRDPPRPRSCGWPGRQRPREPGGAVGAAVRPSLRASASIAHLRAPGRSAGRCDLGRRWRVRGSAAGAGAARAAATRVPARVWVFAYVRVQGPARAPLLLPAGSAGNGAAVVVAVPRGAFGGCACTLPRHQGACEPGLGRD